MEVYPGLEEGLIQVPVIVLWLVGIQLRGRGEA